MTRIVLFVFILAFFLFKISYWSKVYGSELNSLEVITLQKCKKIITDGKIIKRPADEDGRFYSLFYNNQEYFVEIKVVFLYLINHFLYFYKLISFCYLYL